MLMALLAPLTVLIWEAWEPPTVTVPLRAKAGKEALCAAGEGDGAAVEGEIAEGVEEAAGFHGAAGVDGDGGGGVGGVVPPGVVAAEAEGAGVVDGDGGGGADGAAGIR